MEANYLTRNPSGFHNEQKYFVVSNYQGSNVIATYGFKFMPKITKTDIGVWKIKKRK